MQAPITVRIWTMDRLEENRCNWQAGLSLYNTEPESGSGDSSNRIQLDFVWKF